MTEYNLLLTILIICFIVFTGFIYKINSKYYKSLSSILNQINQLRHRQVDTKQIPKNSNDVIQEINQSLNEWEIIQANEFEKLKNVDMYRKEFLGNVSHELKTPIFAVEGYLHTLIDGGIDDADINMVYLQKAAKSLDRLSSIVNDLETISRMESGALIIDWRTFNLSDLLLEVIDTHNLRAAQKNIKLLIAATVPKQIYVYADKERIRQVIDNLIVNSIKYGKTGGTTELSISETNTEYIVHIKDNGMGIEEKHLTRLFERFYRVDKHRSRNEGGTGLGLAIVKHIIESHNQSITVQSKFNEGSVFSFSLKRSI